MPYTFLDVPYADDEASVDYLAEQLKEFAYRLAEHCGRSFDEEKLKEIIRTENETRDLLEQFFQLQKDHWYPGELISHLYLMMGTHLMMGTRELRDLAAFLVEDIQKYPAFDGKRILWVHLMPFYQETLKEYFNENQKYQIIASDMELDGPRHLDENAPFRVLAQKTIANLFNGSYSHKAKVIGDLAEELQPDAVIHFCHWGCKQAAGGSILLKEKMQELGIPMLILDGDGIDRRNSHDGQIRTRLEAFLEMLEAEQKVC